MKWLIILCLGLLAGLLVQRLGAVPFSRTNWAEPLIADRVVGVGQGLNLRHPLGWLGYASLLIAILVVICWLLMFARS